MKSPENVGEGYLLIFFHGCAWGKFMTVCIETICVKMYPLDRDMFDQV